MSDAARVLTTTSEYAVLSIAPVESATEAITMPTAPRPPSITAICLAEPPAPESMKRAFAA